MSVDELNPARITVSTTAMVQQGMWWNWNTRCQLHPEHLIASLVDCWYLRQQYYQKDWFRVPVPATYQTKHVFHTSIHPLNQGAAVIRGTTCAFDHPFSKGGIVVLPGGSALQARHVELIVIEQATVDTSDVLPLGAIKNASCDWQIVAIRGTLEKDIPAHPLELAMYDRISAEDMRQATLFWSQHFISVPKRNEKE